MRQLYPGRPVPLQCGLSVTVYPIGYRHLKKFSGLIGRGLAMLADQAGSLSGAEDGVRARVVMQSLLPLVLADGLELLGECVDTKLDDLPHWEIAPLAEAWVLESFGQENKYRPWLQAIENTVSNFTGKPFSISETLSKLSSPAATDSTTSSTTASPVVPTEAGPSLSSSSGVSEPGGT